MKAQCNVCHKRYARRYLKISNTTFCKQCARKHKEVILTHAEILTEKELRLIHNLEEEK